MRRSQSINRGADFGSSLPYLGMILRAFLSSFQPRWGGRLLLLVVLLGDPATPLLRAQEQPPAKALNELPSEQERLARRYRDFEAVIERMANLMERTDPEKSALLRQVFARSRHDLVNSRLLEIVELLQSADFKKAAGDQEKLVGNLEAILELLLTEDRGRLVRQERERIERLIAEVRKLERGQKELLGQTERAARDANPPQWEANLADKQGDLADKARKLAENAAPKNSPENSKKTTERTQDDQGGAPKESNKDSKESPEEAPSGAEEKSNPPEDASRSPAEGSPSKPSPGQKGLSEASEAMDRAQKNLQDKKNEPASQEQQQAIRELEKTIAELDEILRQLREEERVERLVGLEARCRKMLGMQQAVLEGVAKVDRVPKDRRSRADEQRSISLSREESLIVAEADQAILLLREDGTAIAFPEAFEQLRNDTRMISGLLGKVETGAVTQGLCSDVIATLEEMIQSLERQIREAKKSKPAPPQGSGNAPPPLLDKLAELKLVRSMQNQVNQRTQRIADQRAAPSVDGEKGGESPELDLLLLDLARRQERIYIITRGIADETREKKP